MTGEMVEGLAAPGARVAARRYNGSAAAAAPDGVAPGWAGEERPPAAPEPLVGFKASELSGIDVPEREWHVADLMPARNVTLFSANGGDGKSLLILQLSVATALGRVWLGRQCQRGAVLYLSAEDDRAEVHRRLRDIAVSEGVSLADLGDVEVLPMVGEDVVLALPDREGLMKRTAFFERLRGALRRVRPVLLVLDTAADVFGGDEIKKYQVRQFLSMLRGLCVEFDTTVLLISHPSQAGMMSGQGTSGNVAWSNSVRSRWYLERVRGDDRSEPDPDARTLTVMKSNYGQIGEVFRLQWQQGVFMMAPGATAKPGPFAAAQAEAVFLDLLREFGRQGRTVSATLSASTYAPALFAKEQDARGISKASFSTAMSGLLRGNRIKVVTTGSPSRQRSHLAAA